MASFDEDYYEYADPMGSSEQNLVAALDVGVQQSVNHALFAASESLKKHLFSYAEQQGWLPPHRCNMDPVGSPLKPIPSAPSGPHALACDHDYGVSREGAVSDHDQDECSSISSQGSDHD